MSEIQPRIVASEMEWDVSWKRQGQSLTHFDKGSQLLRSSLHPEVTITEDGYNMLSNGGRYYQDVGFHLEYATPEDTRLIDGVVANEFAGELLVIDSLARYMKKDDEAEKIHVSKRVIDDENHVWGYHMNLSADRDVIKSVNDEHLHLLGLHLASSQAMLGSGAVYRPRLGAPYQYSFGQKITSIQYDFGSSTTRDRPLINTRDEHHAHSKSIRRLHIISGDPHVSPWATAMAFGTMSLILRAVEQGRGKDLHLDMSGQLQSNTALARLAVQTALDLSQQKHALFQDGKTYRPLDIQKKLFAIVEKAEYTDEEAWALNEWCRAIEDQERDMMLLQDRSDAIAKLALLRSMANKYREEAALDDQKIDWSIERLRMLDRTYGQVATIRPNQLTGEADALAIHQQSIPHHIRARQFGAYMPEQSVVLDRMINPPTTTRAYVRGTLIKQAGPSVSANWKSIRIAGRDINLDPLDVHLPDDGVSAA